MRLFAVVVFALSLAGHATAAPAPRVLASIKPLHSIVAAVMGEAGAPELLISGEASPHSYALKPSDARKIAGADIIFWVGPSLEAFLETPLKNLAPRADIVAVSELPGIRRLPARRGGVWEGDPDAQGSFDGHVWLDPINGIAIAREAAKALGTVDPARAALYAANADRFAMRISVLEQGLATRLAPVRDRPYIVFHDAFHYFEDHYGLSPAGAVTVASDRPPGARRIEELRTRIAQAGAICVFTAPQFSPRIVRTLTEGTHARTATLDALGADIPVGPDLYETLLTRMAESLVACLGR